MGTNAELPTGLTTKSKIVFSKVAQVSEYEIWRYKIDGNFYLGSAGRLTDWTNWSSCKGACNTPGTSERSRKCYVVRFRKNWFLYFRRLNNFIRAGLKFCPFSGEVVTFWISGNWSVFCAQACSITDARYGAAVERNIAVVRTTLSRLRGSAIRTTRQTIFHVCCWCRMPQTSSIFLKIGEGLAVVDKNVALLDAPRS